MTQLQFETPIKMPWQLKLAAAGLAAAVTINIAVFFWFGWKFIEWLATP